MSHMRNGMLRKVHRIADRFPGKTDRKAAVLDQATSAFRRLAAMSASPVAQSVCPIRENHVEQMIAHALHRYGEETDLVKWWARLRTDQSFFPHTGMYDWVEAQILYLLIRLRKPESVVEISPNYGYSTGFMLLAMNKNDRGQLYSFDVSAQFHRHALRNFAKVGIDASRLRFFAGDVRVESYHSLPSTIDLLFLDSDHSDTFAEWYLDDLWPRIAGNGLLHVHDVLRYGVKPNLGDEGEGLVLWEFIQEQQIPETDFMYVSEFVRAQPTRPEILRRLARYPFGETRIGTDGIEQNASLWLVRRPEHAPSE